MHLAFKEATNRNCNVQVLCFQSGPNSNFNLILYYCCCAAKTVKWLHSCFLSRSRNCISWALWVLIFSAEIL